MMVQDRLNHSIAVARKMVEIGKKYNLDDEQLQDLFLSVELIKFAHKNINCILLWL